MQKLIRYLKPFTLIVIAVLVCLALQAYCDLSLPDYTSGIVNVGIQQGGIESAVPQALRQSTMGRLTLLMDADQKAEALQGYTLLKRSELSASDYAADIKKYPVLATEPVYVLNETGTKDKARLESIMGKAFAAVSGIEKSGLSASDGKAAATGDAAFKTLAALPADKQSAVRSALSKQVGAMTPSMVTQTAAAAIKVEYQIIGMDTAAMQSAYILTKGAIMLLLSLLGMVAAVGAGFLSARISAGLGRDLRKDVFSSVTAFSNTEFDRFSTASLITRSTNDISQVQTFTVLLLRIVFYTPIIGVGGILKVSGSGSSMWWIIVAAVAAVVVVFALLFAFAVPQFKKVQKLVDKLNLVTRQILTGIPVIRAFGTQKQEEQNFDGVNRDLTRTNLFVSRLMTLMMPVMMLIMNLTSLLIVWVGGQQVNSGMMQVGDMIAFTQYSMQIIMAFLMLSMISILLPRASVAANRIQEVLSAKSAIRDPASPRHFLPEGKGEVRFEDVSFQYPGAEADALSGISFTAKPGETTAFIGSTGSGKSTLLNLIPRFYDVTSGSVTIDGTDIRDVTRHELRDKIGYVPQKGVLFSGTIATNIGYGVNDASKEELAHAADTAQAGGFIEEKPEGFDAPISQGGTNVSGGQKQRLSIARALAKKPKIYLFDDSFSALDFKTDAALRRALRADTKKATVLIVAQRLSTIRHADKIIVLDEGRIAGMGTHEALMENCEVYRQIAFSQLSKEELAL